MTRSASNLRYTSAGFWLPCYQSSFYSPDSDRSVLQERYAFSKSDHGPFGPNRSMVKLDASMMSRLLMVLPHKGYTSAFPIFPKPSSVYGGVDDLPDPVGILFLSKEPAKLPAINQQSAIQALSLYVDHKGFYFWTAAYAGDHILESSIQAALKAHIAEISGGDFWSHYSGRDADVRLSETLPEESLLRYREDNLGMLTFFQLNTILEGMYNVNLDPRKFFRSDSLIDREQYTVGGFIDKITATYHPAKRPPARLRQVEGEDDGMPPSDIDLHAGVTGMFETYLDDPAQMIPELLHNFIECTDYHRARAHILDEFLIRTEDITLKKMKKRIERARRALLDELIEVTHRRDPLVQVEPPPDDGPEDFIEDVNEAQLRGYVMLVSAKMPLIANVKLHLEDLHYSSDSKKSRGADDLNKQTSAVYGPYHSWTSLLEALESDIDGLIKAINQARTDRMLLEQEQIHAGQETLAEIQRLQERSDGKTSPGSSLAINVISNLLALFAVAFAAAAFFSKGIHPIDLTNLAAIFNSENLPADGELLIGIAMLVLLYAVLHFGLQYIFRAATRVIRRDLRFEAKYYYEMDVHADAPFLYQLLPSLLDHGLPASDAPRRRKTSTASYRNVERNSYRVERTEKAEALHKIYVEADIRVNPRRFVHAILVYELLFHRPAREHGYVFKNLRVVSTHADMLTKNELIMLKLVIVKEFVNPYLESGWRLAPPDESNDFASDNFDAVFTATRIVRNPASDTVGTIATMSKE